MAMQQQHIRNPLEWGWDSLKQTGRVMNAAGHTIDGAWEGHDRSIPAVRRITSADLRKVLRQGFEDFGAYRTDVIFLCVLYPVVGLVLSRMIWGYGMVPLLFPLASGFALIAPFFAVGLYEMSRRREAGRNEGWSDAFGVASSPALGSILQLGGLLLALFVLWMGAAHLLWMVTLGPEPPTDLQVFAREVVTTPAGLTMAIVGVAIGFVFAVAVLVLSVVSFPLLLDRDVGAGTAIATSWKVVQANPGPMALWGLIIAGLLVLGSIPLLLGLAIVFPVLGHATWHLYRKVLPR